MPQFNLPRRTVSMVQLWASVLLIVLAFIFSFMPIITFKTLDNAGEINAMIEQFAPDADFEIPEEVEISSPKLISTIALIANIIGTATAEGGADPDKAAELEDYLKSESGQQDVVTAVCVALTLTKTFNFEGQSDPLSLILNVVIGLIGLLAVLICTIILPIILFFNLIIALIKAAKGAKTPEEVSAAVGARLPGLLSLPLTIMLFQCVVPDMSQGWGIIALCVTCVISVLVNFVCSRLREYPAKQFVYLNVLQGPALVGIVGFLIFFFNIIKTGIFTSFTSGKFSMYFAQVLVAQEMGATVNNAYIIDGVLMLVYLCVMLSCVSYLDKAARRLSCTVKNEKPHGIIGLFVPAKASDNNLILALFTSLAYIAPTVVAGFKHFYNDVTSTAAEGDASFLNITDAGNEALSMALVGIIIMIVAEVAVVVLKGVFCKDLAAHEKEALLLGHAMTSEERLEEAKKIVAESEAAAPAEEAVAEEAPAVEEAVAEEETATEEAPAEEAKAE